MKPEGSLIDHVFLLLIIGGTYFVIMIPGVLGLNYVLFTVPLKWFILLYSFFLIWMRFFVDKRGLRLSGISFFIFFWIIYMGRVVYDLYFTDIEARFFPNPGDYLESIVYCTIPGIALCCIKKIDFNWLLNWSFWIYFVASILSLFISLDIATAEVQRAEGRYGGTQGLNSIIYGHYGVSLSLISFFLFINKSKNLRSIIYIAGFCLGLFIMFLAGSRGPFLALILCLIFYQLNSFGMLRGVAAFSLLLIPFFVFSDSLLTFLSRFGGVFFDRLESAIEGNSTGRAEIFAAAIKDFLDYPLFGRAFLSQSGPVIGEYPHNLVLESLMATGIIGGFFFLGWVFLSLLRSYRILKQRQSSGWIALLFVQQFILGMFSLSIFVHDRFWHLSIFLFLVSLTALRNERPPAAVEPNKIL